MGAPELVCEIATSSVSIDLNAKLNLYRRAGVKEYLVWRTRDGAIDSFASEAGTFVPAPLAPGGIWVSQIFPGLKLDIPAALPGDLAKLLSPNDQIG